ncbi:MAG: hypothetical protein ACI3W5_02760 [Faecousia sp.]
MADHAFNENGKLKQYPSYAVFSIFAGAFSDRWDKKKTMLSCDAMAA